MRVVQGLIAEGKILTRDIERILEIDELENRLRALRGGGEVPVPHVKAKSAKKAVSAAVAATRKVQGQYIAHLRKFPKAAREKFQKIAREDSREKAIVAMKKALAG
jgi:hypothetical protein